MPEAAACRDRIPTRGKCPKCSRGAVTPFVGMRENGRRSFKVADLKGYGKQQE